MSSDHGAVSRETPLVPPVARGVFASRMELADRYAALLAEEGVVRGLLGPREVPRLWTRHLLNCAVVSDELATGTDVADVGSGAGLPGVVLAIRRPDLRMTLIEPLLRRATFLTEAVDRLGLDNVEVLRARAEELHGVRDYTVVTSRAVAPLPRLLAWCMPLVRQGGAVVAMKGRSADRELDDAQAHLRRWGVGPANVHMLGDDLLDPPTTVVRLEATRPSELQWRNSGAGSNPGRRRRGKDRR